MVLTTDNRFSEIYDIIKSDSLQGESVLVLVARDCDSIAACKILTEILKSDLIAYNVKPVSGYEDLEKVNSSLLENEEIKSIIMLNCGGGIDITNTFTNLKDNQVTYIIDSHRPYHPENIENESGALIIDDGTYVEQDEIQQLSSDSEKEDQDDEDDDEDDEEKDENSDKENSEPDNDQDNIGGKTKKNKKRKSMKKKKNRARIERVEKTYYGKSAAATMYKLSTVLQKQNLDDLLWYAVIGLTDQLIHEKITLESYETQYKEFKELILNTYQSNDDDDDNGGDDGVYSNFDDNGNRVTKKSFRSFNGDKIIPNDDFRFMLYRHWNLYESLYNSRYVACKLKVWKAKGRFHLESLFAMMGIPLDQVKQKYVSMNVHYKKQLKHLLAMNGPKFGLINLYFNSFLKKYQCNSEISASDTVYAVTALMESDNLENDQTDEEIWEQNFWEAYDSISSKNVDLLKIGLKQSIELQKEITRQVSAMIEKRSVILSGPFRYAFITENADLKYFIHPLALTKLGLFMMDAFISLGKAKKPFLIGALNEKNQSYLIVGISGSHSSDIQSNQFGVYFRKSAEYTDATLKYQSFDTSIIEISKQDLHKFVEHLHGSLI